MVDTYARIDTMRDMLLYAQDLHYWCYNSDYELLYSNATNQEFFHHIFLVGSCFDTLKKHFETSKAAAICSDKSGIAWIASVQAVDAPGKNYTYHILGPFFSVETSEAYLYQLCQKLHVSSNLISDLMKNLNKITTIPLNSALRYAVMLQYCANGIQCTPDDIALYIDVYQPNTNQSWAEYNYHGTWELECKLFQQIRDGNAHHIQELLTAFSSGRVGTICPDNPLRQAKDELIVFITLCSRAIILGGVSPEGSYNMADFYLQKVEACEHVSEVQNCSLEMLHAFIRRSKQAKNGTSFSVPITNTMEYIENHIGEKINLEKMAGEIGYTGYYLSNKFQREVGMTINHFIQKRKIETAKDMLKTSRYSIADVSEQLAFSSPSYFSSIFRKYEGITPGDFLKNIQNT